MRPTATILLATFLGLAPGAVPAPAADADRYGAGVQIQESTPIAAILAAPADWQGRRVRVEGVVSGVCRARGCWMELRSADAAIIRIKVEDGVIVFPVEAEGRNAAAEGVVEVLDLSREQYRGWMAHLAEEQGTAFDEASLGEGPFQVVQIAGAGAEIAPE